RGTGTGAPLRARPPAAARVETGPAGGKPKPVSSAPARVATGRAATVAKPAPQLEPVDRRTRQRLARGTVDIDGRIDLHGKTQTQAYGALLRFLHRAQADGARFVLVVTGKGARAGDGRGGGGVLKRQVPLWLKLPEFRAYVSGFEDAHIGHGGEGALYVRVRRPR